MGKTNAFGTIRKLPSGRYQARYWHLGKQVSGGTTFPTKADAKAWLAGVETDLRRGAYIEPSAGTIRFEQYAAEWLEDRALRPRTRETYESQLKHILDWFGRAPLREIGPTDVREWHGQMLRLGLSENTVAKVYRMFRTIMTTAVDDGLLRSNPVSIRGAARESTVERPLLTWDDVARLADAIDPRYRAFVWTAAASGLRFGELTGLDRSRVDLQARKIRVDRALGFVRSEGPSLGPPKSDAAYRSVAIPEQICDLLEEHMAEYSNAGKTGLVFTSVKGSPLLNRYFAPAWERAKREAGIEAGVRFHDLRHLAGTTAASTGASLREVMARMGHASSDASLRYLKASESRDRKIADDLGAYIESVQRPSPTTSATSPVSTAKRRSRSSAKS
jgi:integrase